MDTLNKSDRELLWLYALGEPLSEQDSQRFLHVMTYSAHASNELRHHLRFKDLMSSGKVRLPGTGFTDETMRRISTLNPPALYTPHSPSPSTARTHEDIKTSYPSNHSRRAFFIFVLLVIIGHVYLIRPKTIHAPPGQEHIVILNGTSEAKIQSGSSLVVFPSYLRAKNKVIVKGEAFFDIKPDNKPFVIKTQNAVITVNETQLNVRTHRNPTTPKTLIDVYEGLARVAATDVPDQVVRLKGGESTQVLGTRSAPEARKPILSEMSIF